MIQYRFDYINQELFIISKEVNCEVMLTKLRCIRPLHMKVIELVIMFNAIFGVNILMLIAMFFMQLILKGYLIVDLLTGTKLIYYLITRFSYLTMYVIYVWIICYVCHQTEYEVKMLNNI